MPYSLTIVHLCLVASNEIAVARSERMTQLRLWCEFIFQGFTSQVDTSFLHILQTLFIFLRDFENRMAFISIMMVRQSDIFMEYEPQFCHHPHRESKKLLSMSGVSKMTLLPRIDEPVMSPS